MNAVTFNSVRKNLDSLKVSVSRISLVEDDMCSTDLLDVEQIRECLRNIRVHATVLEAALMLNGGV